MYDESTADLILFVDSIPMLARKFVAISARVVAHPTLTSLTFVELSVLSWWRKNADDVWRISARRLGVDYTILRELHDGSASQKG